MPENDNVLIRYGMSLSLCEMAINSQFEEAWDIWLHAQSIEDTIRIECIGEDSRPYLLTATLEAPSISLTGGRPGFADLMVTLPIAAGTVEISPGGERFELDGARLSFPVNLKKEPTSPEELEKVDPDAAERAQEIVNGARRNDNIAYDKLSIEALLLDLSNPAFIQQGMTIQDSSGEPFSPEKAKIVAQCFAQLLRDGASQDCILGTLVHVKPEAKRQSTLVPTSFTYDIFTDLADPRVSSLNYLGTFAGAPLPMGEDRRAGIFGSWIDPQKVVSGGLTAGVMAIRGEDFSGFIVNALAEALHPQQCFRSRHSAEFFTHHQNIQVHEGNAFEYDIVIRQDISWRMELAHHPERASYDIDVVVDVFITLAMSHSLLSNFQGGWSSSARSRMTLMLEEKNDEELGFSVLPRLLPARPEFYREKVRFKEIEHSWTRDVDRAIGKVLGQGSPEEMCERETDQLTNHISGALADAFSALEMRLGHFEFIPPADQEFLFTTPRFSPRGDLLLDVKYRSPIIVA